MNKLETLKIDLTEFKETSFNPFFYFSDEKEKHFEDFLETNNKFGWNVSYGQISINKTDKTINRVYTE